MPIEIKELHIHVTVDASQDGRTSPPASGGAGNQGSGDPDHDKDAIVAECVEQVLQILQHKKER